MVTSGSKSAVEIGCDEILPPNKITQPGVSFETGDFQMLELGHPTQLNTMPVVHQVDGSMRPFLHDLVTGGAVAVDQAYGDISFRNRRR
jgi:hypothetical protein